MTNRTELSQADRALLSAIWVVSPRELSASQRRELPALEARLRQSVQRGDLAAMTSLAYLLLRFTRGKASEIERLIRRAAEGGDPAAQLRWAALLQQKGRHRAALPWLKRSAAQGLNESLFRLGYLLVRPPSGVKQDMSGGISLLKSAHRKGHPLAAEWLAIAYDGMRLPNRRAAYRWYRVAAMRENPSAMHNLAVCYENGEGTSRNLELARKFYGLAARTKVRGSQESLERVRRKLRAQQKARL